MSFRLSILGQGIMLLSSVPLRSSILRQGIMFLSSVPLRSSTFSKESWFHSNIIDYTIFQLSFLYELAVYRLFFKFTYYHSLVCRFVRTLVTKEQVENVLIELGNKQFQKFVKNMDKGDPYAELPKLRYTLMFIQCHPYLSYTYFLSMFYRPCSLSTRLLSVHLSSPYLSSAHVCVANDHTVATY